MRLLGGLMLIVCAGLAGMAWRDRLSRRVALLGSVCTFIERLSCGIEYGRITPDKVLAGMEKRSGSFFGRCQERMADGEHLDEAWRKAALTGEAQLLRPDELCELLALGEELGRSDAKSQLAMLRRRGEALRRAHNDAREEYRQKARMYISCPLLLGTLVALIVI